MSKKNFWLIMALTVIALVASGCGKKINQPTINGENLNQNTQKNDDGVDNPSGNYTINELLSMNRPMKCSWQESANKDNDVTNIIYVSGKKFYQDVTMGDIGHFYTISDGETIYIWNNFNDKASKISMKEMENQPNQGAGNAGGGANLEQKKDFVCGKWKMDSSVFNPPADRNFKDITEGMTGAISEIQGNADEYTEQACDMCRQAPTQELRDTCLAEVGCE
jgi:hypothetical protein